MTGRLAGDLALYLVVGSASCGSRGVAATVAAAVAGGCTAVQLREPSASTRELCRLAEGLQVVLAGTGVPLLVNDRVDVALAVGADGVHLGQSDLEVTTARRLLGDRALVGLSVSTPTELEAVGALPPGTVDYLGVGPVFATPTKPDAAAPLGLGGTAALRAATDLPCVAIGGITAANAAAVRDTGVDGIAVVSAVCAAPDPRQAAAALRAAAPPGSGS